MNRRDFFKYGLAGIGTVAFVRNAAALEYYPMPSDEKWAVLYGTWCGSARDAAVWISEGMGGIANVFDVREQPDLSAYEHIVIGGAIRNSVTRSELQDYLKANKALLKEKTRGYFAVCGNMGNPVGPQQTTLFIDNHLAKLCEVGNLPSRVFLGRITKSLMDPQTAQMMAGVQDYDNLKRADCMAFGHEVIAISTFAEKVGPEQLKEFRLEQNYPNPFNPSTEIFYSLEKSGNVLLQIFNVNGKRVRTLLDSRQSSGYYFIQWDGRDDFGQAVASEAYFYLLKFNGQMLLKRMLKVK